MLAAIFQIDSVEAGVRIQFLLDLVRGGE